MSDPQKINPWNEHLHPHVPDFQLSLPAQMARQQRLQQQAQPYQPSSSGHSDSGDRPVLAWLIGLGLTAVLSPWLYPLTVLLAYGAKMGASLLFDTVSPGHPALSQAVSLLGGLIAFVGLSRLDHRAASRWRPYWWIRHLLRLVLAGAVAVLVLMHGGLLPMAYPSWSAVLAEPPWAALGIILGTLVILHLVLACWKRPRDWWHQVQVFVRLRPSSL